MIISLDFFPAFAGCKLAPFTRSTRALSKQAFPEHKYERGREPRSTIFFTRGVVEVQPSLRAEKYLERNGISVLGGFFSFELGLIASAS